MDVNKSILEGMVLESAFNDILNEGFSIKPMIPSYIKEAKKIIKVNKLCAILCIIYDDSSEYDIKNTYDIEDIENNIKYIIDEYKPDSKINKIYIVDFNGEGPSEYYAEIKDANNKAWEVEIKDAEYSPSIKAITKL